MSFLLVFEDGYELSENGKILYKADDGLDKLLRAEKIDIGKGDIKQELQELILRNYKYRFVVKDFSKFLNRLVDIIVKKF